MYLVFYHPFTLPFMSIFFLFFFFFSCVLVRGLVWDIDGCIMEFIFFLNFLECGLINQYSFAAVEGGHFVSSVVHYQFRKGPRHSNSCSDDADFSYTFA
jgi:hypothetical protein